MYLKAIPRQSLEISFKEFIVVFKGIFSSDKNKISEFEKKFANFIGTKYAVSFSSLRGGLYQIFKLLDFNPSDEIILPAYEFYIVPAVVVLARLKPVFVDVNPHNYTLDPKKIEKAITKKTKAIIVVHLNGYPAEMDKITKIAKKHNLRIIEDCAHACGSEFKGKKLGSFDIGSFSFGPGKNLTTMGGGMITTNDSVLAQKLKRSKKQQERESFWLKLKIITKTMAMRLLTLPFIFLFTAYPLLLLAQFINLNSLLKKLEAKIKIPQKAPLPSSLTSTQATLGIEQLKQLEKRNQVRINNAKLYNQQLAELKRIEVSPLPKNGKNVYAHYPIKVANIDKFIKRLSLKRIDIQKDYCSNCNSLKIFRKFKANCPTANKIEGKIVYLPNHPSIGVSQVKFIARETTQALQ